MKIGTKRHKVNKAWLNDHVNDPYVKLARKEGYRARSAYKLKEIDEALGLLKPGQSVVELGSAPGAWSQYLHRRLQAEGPHGQTIGAARIIALDMLDMEPVAGVEFIQGDFRDDAVMQRLRSLVGGRRLDVVVSDMAPNLSGIAAADAARIEHLVELAVEFAVRCLQYDGALVCKVFHGSGYSQWVKLFKQHFRSVRAMKPKASRDKSAEVFLVGIGLKSQ